VEQNTAVDGFDAVGILLGDSNEWRAASVETKAPLLTKEGYGFSRGVVLCVSSPHVSKGALIHIRATDTLY
ncbi:MAG: hypothetical protein ACJ72Z_09520, partial [Pyrinomonadaceae bacterium]